MRKLLSFGCLLVLTLTLSAWDFSSTMEFGYIVSDDDFTENAMEAEIGVSASPDEKNTVSLIIMATPDALTLDELSLSTKVADSLTLGTAWHNNEISAVVNVWLMELAASANVDPSANDYDGSIQAVVGPVTGMVFYETNGVPADWVGKEGERYKVRNEGLIEVDVDFAHDLFSVGAGINQDIRAELTTYEGRATVDVSPLEVLSLRASFEGDTNSDDMNSYDLGGGLTLFGVTLDLGLSDDNGVVVDEALKESETMPVVTADVGVVLFENYGVDAGVTFQDGYKGADVSAYANIGAAEYRIGYLDCDEYNADDGDVERNAPSVLTDGGAYFAVTVSY